MHILLTGVTGAIGSYIAPRLLAKGCYLVVIARGNHEMSAEERVRKAIGLSGKLPSNLTILEGDVAKPLCGIAKRNLNALRHKIDTIIHAAAVTKYDRDIEGETKAVNVGGTHECLKLADELQVSHFVYVSTAYVSGQRPLFREKDIGRISDTQNPYEATKQEAEQVVREWAKCPYTILRLSTVVGDSQNGETSGFGGFYGFVRSVWNWREQLRRFAENPIIIPINPDTTLNLIPIDWVYEMMWNVLSARVEGTFHLTHTTPVSLKWLFEVSSDVLNLPVMYGDLSQGVPGDRARDRIQDVILKKSVRHFGRYVLEDTVFGHENIVNVPGYYPPPPIDEDFIEKILQYAEKHNFGVVRQAAKLEVVA